MNQYERDYAGLIRDVLYRGERRQTRNGFTLSSFGKSFKVTGLSKSFPLLQGRKLFYKGVLGEFAAMLRGPKHIDDFKRFGCNYWDKFANPDGTIDIDYGNQWIDFNGVNQLKMLVESIMNDPHGRRHVINAWRPDRLDKVNLPCCHFLYQFYVTKDDRVEMLWYQRSADVMIGIPSDVILAAIFLLLVCNETDRKPGDITMVFGDTHIYEEHVVGAETYLQGLKTIDYGTTSVKYKLSELASLSEWQYKGPEVFVPEHLEIENYMPLPAINFELKV
jgi:thymidylate synthase